MADLASSTKTTSDIEWVSTNLFDLVPISEWQLVNAVENNKVVTIAPSGSLRIVLLKQHFKTFACNYLKQVVTYSGSASVSANYKPKAFAFVDMKYTGSQLTDNNLILFNKDVELPDTPDKYINNVVVEIKPKEIESISFSVVNKSESPLILEDLKLYKSLDLSPYQIVEVLKQDSIVGDIISSTASFTEATLTQYLRTNVLSMSDLRSLNGGNKVNYVEVQDWEVSFRSSQLSTTSLVQYEIPLVSPEGLISTKPVFHAVSKGHPLYGQAFTIVNPRDKFPSMTDIEYEKWKLKVWESDVTKEHLAIRFESVVGADGSYEDTPVITLGAGVNPSDITDFRGKLQIYTDYLGGHIKYTDKNGQVSEIRTDETGMRAANLFIKPVKIVRYNNGSELFFEGDPDPTKVIFNEDSSGNLSSMSINGVNIPMPVVNSNLL